MWLECDQSVNDSYALSAGSGVIVVVHRVDPDFFSLSELKPGTNLKRIEHPTKKWTWWFSHPTFLALESYVVPIWVPAVLLGAMSAWLWRGDIRRRRYRRAGLCLSCGYDRRGLAPTSACPECGKT